MKLAVVESPGKIKKIQRFLGSDWVVKASIGHCYEIEKKNDAIDIDNNFEPRYVPIKEKSKVISEIKALAKKCSSIFICTDADREGMCIGYHLSLFALKEYKSKIKRATFNEITKSAILNAIKNAYDLEDDIDLYHSQQARAVVDRLVGFKVSGVLQNKVLRGTSAGRVQSIGLRLIVDRDKEIKAFIPEEYWDIKGKFETVNKESFIAAYRSSDKIINGVQSKSIVDSINKDKNWKIASIEKSEKTKKPSPPFSTSTMQQFSANVFSWPGKKTMGVAQSLYELGKITYHRTDSLSISKEAMEEVRNFILPTFGKDYLPSQPKFYKSKSASAQEAHEAVRVTNVAETPQSIKTELDNDQYKLYEAIYYKFVSSQMEDCILDTVKVSLDADSKKHVFVASGQTIKFDGFLKAWPYGNTKDEDLPKMEEKELSNLIEVVPEQHFTKSKSFFNDSSLIAELDDQGVGRPSTYASIIETLIARTYVIREGKAFKPTELGILVCDYLIEAFPELMDITYTARIETNLDKIEENKLVWYEVVRDFYEELKKRLDTAKNGESKKTRVETDIVCPTCGKNKLIRRRSRFGEFYGCSGYEIKGEGKCKATFKIGEDDQPVKSVPVEKRYLENKFCDKCGSKIIIKISKKTGKEFYGCSGWPKCKRLFDENGVVKEFKKRTFKKKGS